MSDSISSTDRESKTQTAEEQEYNRLKEALNSNTKALEKFIASGNGGLLENSNALRQESTRLADYVKQLLNDRERASLSEDEEKALDKELEKLIVQIQHADAMTLMQNFHLDIGKAREIKELLERGDVDFQTRYNELSCWLDDDKIWFEQFCSRFPNSDHLAGIQKLKEEAESEFDDVTQSMKEMEEEEQAEESVADKSSFENFCAEFPNSDYAEEIQDLQDEAQSKFEDVTQSMKEKEEEEEAEESVADKSSFENFREEFPESDHLAGIQDLQEKAQSKFEDVTQSMKEKEPRSNLSLSSAFHTMLFGAVITLIGVYMVTGAQSDFLLIMIMVLTGLTFGIMLKRLLCC